MSLDNHDRSPRNGEPALEIPGWVPIPAAVQAQILYRWAAVEHLPFLQRMISNPLMEQVWDELRSRVRENHKPTDRYLHPVRMDSKKLVRYFDGAIAFHNADLFTLSYEIETSEQALVARHYVRDANAQEAGLVQELAFAKILRSAFLAKTTGPLVVVSTGSAKKKHAEMLDLAERCGGLADRLQEINFFDDLPSRLRDRQRELQADAVEELAKGNREGKIRRSKPEKDEMRAYILALSHTFRELFSQELSGLVAHIANIAFPGAEITRSVVSSINKAASYPTVKDAPWFGLAIRYEEE
jgi:hypothetical protein